MSGANTAAAPERLASGLSNKQLFLKRTLQMVALVATPSVAPATMLAA